jgi:hypothetical protein
MRFGMSESNQLPDSPIGPNAAAPWLILLHSVSLHAQRVANEIMADMVLGESVSNIISAYLTQHDKFTSLRKEFAEADLYCGSLRKDAREMMAKIGFEFEWDLEDLNAVDAQLVSDMKEATDKAAAINKLRAEAGVLQNQLLVRAVDEMALCASIVVLRHMDQYTSEGEAFCVAYAATFALREKAIEDTSMQKAIETLSEWLQYSIGVKKRAVEWDIFSQSRLAAGIGRGMSIANSAALCVCLIDAMKKCNAKKTE